MKKVRLLLACLVAMLSFAQSLQAQSSSAKLSITSAEAKKSDGSDWEAYYTYSLNNIYDGSTSTKFWSNGSQSLGNYIKLNLSQLARIEKIKFTFDSGDQPEGVAIDVSTDGTNWTEGVGSFSKSNISNNAYELSLSGYPLARYIKMRITTQTGNWLQIVEMEPWGFEVVDISELVHFSDAPTNGVWAANTQWYKIKNGKGNYLSSSFVKSGTDHLSLDGSGDPGMDGYWCVVGNEDDGYSFYHYNTGKILEMSGASTAEANVYARITEPTSITDGFTTKFDLSCSIYTASGDTKRRVMIKAHGSNNAYWTKHGNDGLACYNCLAYWQNDLAMNDNGSSFFFEPVDLSAIDVTINYNNGGEYSFTKTIQKVPGTSVELADVNNVSYFKNFAITSQNTEVQQEVSIDVTCDPDFPMIPGRVYKLTSQPMQSDHQCFSYESASTNKAKFDFSDSKVTPNSYWCFEHISGTENMFYVYNMGAKKYLSFKNERNYAIFEDKESPTSGYTTKVRITPNGTGFNLQHETGYACCSKHMSASGEGNRMGSWTGGEEGLSNSDCRIFAIEIAEELANLVSSPVAEGEYVGSGTSPLLQTTAPAASSNPTLANVAACMEAYTNPQLHHYITANKYYQIHFKATTGDKILTHKNATAPYSSGSFGDAENTAVAAVATAEASTTDYIASLYQLIPGSNGVRVRAVNLGQSWGDASSTGPATTTGEGTEYVTAVVAEKDDNSYWNFKVGDNNYLAYSNDETSITTSLSPNEARVKAVTTIPVTIKSTLWTSLCLPVDVTMPDNVVAYKGSISPEGRIELKAIPKEDKIPAGQGFLALADENSYTDGQYLFPIATGEEANADMSNNCFSGAKIKCTGMTDVTYYALATKNQITGFYKVASGTVPANKAYILGSALHSGNNTNMLQLTMVGEGETTSISHNNLLNNQGRLFDLKGQQVVYPSRGVYVTEDGKKIFIK